MSAQKTSVPLYRMYGNGTAVHHVNHDTPRDTHASTPSIKALASTYLENKHPVHPVVQKPVQQQKKCTTEIEAGGTPERPDLTAEKIFNITLPALEYASKQLVPCPASGVKAHFWACARCPHNSTCQAMTGREDTLKDWLLYDFPHSLGLTEGLFKVEPDNPLFPMKEACPDFYKGCFSCRYCNFSKTAFCGKYSRAGRVLS